MHFPNDEWRCASFHRTFCFITRLLGPPPVHFSNSPLSSSLNSVQYFLSLSTCSFLNGLCYFISLCMLFSCMEHIYLFFLQWLLKAHLRSPSLYWVSLLSIMISPFTSLYQIFMLSILFFFLCLLDFKLPKWRILILLYVIIHPEFGDDTAVFNTPSVLYTP